MNGIEDLLLKNYILQFTDDENSDLNRILGSLNFAVFSNRIMFDVKIVDGVIQPLDALSKVIGVKDIDMYLKLLDGAANVVGILHFEKCKLLSIRNFEEYLRFSLRNSFEKIETIDVEYRFERITYNGMVLLEGNNPLKSLKSESKRSMAREDYPMSIEMDSAPRDPAGREILIMAEEMPRHRQEIYTDYEKVPYQEEAPSSFIGTLMKG